LLGLSVGLAVGTTVESSGASVGSVDGVSVAIIDGTALAVEVGAIVPLQEPTTFQVFHHSDDSVAPGTSSELSQKKLMHSYMIPSEDIVDPMSYEAKESNAPGQPPMNMMGCCVGIRVIDGIPVGVRVGN